MFTENKFNDLSLWSLGYDSDVISAVVDKLMKLDALPHSTELLATEQKLTELANLSPNEIYTRLLEM